MTAPFIPAIVNETALFMSGLQATWLSNTQIQLAAGHCNDQTGKIDLDVGEPLILDITRKGINGVDTGSITPSSGYAVYIIGDSSGYNPVGCIATKVTEADTWIPDATITLPKHYDSARLRMYFAVDSSGFIRKFYFSGDDNTYTMQYDELELIAFVSYTSFATYNLLPLVPPASCIADLEYNLSVSNPGGFFRYRPAGGTGVANTTIQSGATAISPNYGLISSASENNGNEWGVDVVVNNALNVLSLRVHYYSISV